MRRNHKKHEPIKIGDQTRSISEWVSHPDCKVTAPAIYRRIKGGWQPVDAITKPPRKPTERAVKPITIHGETKAIGEWIKDPRVPFSTWGGYYRRIEKGMTPEQALTHPPMRKPRNMPAEEYKKLCREVGFCPPPLKNEEEEPTINAPRMPYRLRQFLTTPRTIPEIRQRFQRFTPDDVLRWERAGRIKMVDSAPARYQLKEAA